VQTNTRVAAISRFLCLWFTMSCTMGGGTFFKVGGTSVSQKIY